MCLFKRKNLYDITYEVVGIRKRTFIEAANIARAVKKINRQQRPYTINVIDWEIIG